MEWPALVVGQPSPLVAHFTDARDPAGFAWVTAGAVTARLRYADGAEETFSVDHLLRNGIFKPVVIPTRAGRAELTLVLSGAIAGTVPVGAVEVFADVAGAVASAPSEEVGEPTVGYLKESQWKTVYATSLAEQRPVRGSIRATGELTAAAGAKSSLGSPLVGRLEGTALLRVGAQVRPGDLLARVIGLGAEDRPALETDLAAAEAEVTLATQAAARAEALYPAVISARERDAAQAALTLARRRLSALQGRGRAWSGGGTGGAEIRATQAGTVAFVRAAPGSVVSAGDPVVEIVQADPLWLTAHVFDADRAALPSVSGAMFTVAGRAAPLLIGGEAGGGLLAIGPAIDPIDRTVPVVFSLPNPGDLLPGSYADVWLFTAPRDVVAVPVEAVVDDNGVPVVYVMEGGESFYRRRVEVGARDGFHVEIRTGVTAGERVVSRGAYEILLATSAGGIPAHGHQH